MPAIGQPRAHQRPETMRLYAAEWLAFAAWCRAAKRVALPADAETLADYLLAAAANAGRGALGRKRAAMRTDGLRAFVQDIATGGVLVAVALMDAEDLPRRRHLLMKRRKRV